jgi:Ni/Co efflux regulator RcnB
MIMFKSIISSIIAVSVLATPVVAEAKGRGEHRTERHERNRGNHINTGEAIAIGLGALILGAAIGGSKREQYEEESYEDRPVYARPRYDYRGRDAYYRRDRNCRTTEVIEYDYYGNRYIRRERRCF